MYKQRFTQDDVDKLKVADRSTLLKFLQQSDDTLVNELRTNPNKDDIRFLQGVSHAIQNILKVLA